MRQSGAEQFYILRGSRLLALFLVLCAGFSLMLLFSLPLSPLWQWVGASAVLAPAGFVLLRDAWQRLPQSCLKFGADSNRGISLYLRGGEAFGGRVEDSSFVSPWLTLINLVGDGGKRRSLVILPDSLDREEFRRLRVRLRWQTQA